MNVVYGYCEKTKKFSMEWENQIFYFFYDIKLMALTKVWDSEGKFIARSHKGFRNKLGIKNGSLKANELMSVLKKCKQILDRANYV